MKKSLTLILSVIIVCIWAAMMFFGYDEENTDIDVTSAVQGEMLVHYIDVGQGDSIFINLPNGENMLIDTGEAEYGEKVESYIKNCGVEKIDYMVLTHPHSDHMGAASHIIRCFETGKLFMPDKISTSPAFERLLDAIEEKNCLPIAAEAGVNILSQNGLDIKIISPSGNDYEEVNDYSAVIKIVYKNNSFLFMGDAERKAENKILENNYDVRADVIKIGHHGSSTSSSKKFMWAVAPKLAVISLGKDNSYGHPHKEVKKLLKDLKIPYLRTDEEGDIVIKSDGENITVM